MEPGGAGGTGGAGIRVGACDGPAARSRVTEGIVPSLRDGAVVGGQVEDDAAKLSSSGAESIGSWMMARIRSRTAAGLVRSAPTAGPLSSCAVETGSLADATSGAEVSAAAASMTATNGTLASAGVDRKSTRLNSSHMSISYAVFCL